MRAYLPAMLLAALACGASAGNGDESRSPVPTQHDQLHHHDHGPQVHERGAGQPAAVAGQRFATDPALRENMREIRDSVDALAHYEMGHMDPDHAAQIASDITGHVREIIANCELPPDADAALHAIIAPLMGNAQLLQADPEQTASIAEMREVLDEYALLFEDPGFAD